MIAQRDATTPLAAPAAPAARCTPRRLAAASSVPPRTLAVAGCLALAGIVGLAGCAGEGPPPPPEPAAAPVSDAYRQEIETWRAERLARLTTEDGWLSLVGLFWLVDGVNPVGSEPAATVVLPASAPQRVGEMTLEDGRVSITAASGAGVAVVRPGEGEDGEEDGIEPLAAGRPLELRPDTSEEGPTVLMLRSLRFYVVERDGRLGVRVKDAESPVRRDFAGIESYPIDPAWRLAARFEPHDPPRELAVPNILGTVSREPSAGAVAFEVDGETYRLDAIAAPGDRELFLVFGDRTNGKETYGGGRFLYAEAPAGGAAGGDGEGDGEMVLDFNRAYNPPCVFTEFATCPLPPPGNKLSIRVEAGEKGYAELH